MFDLLDIDEVYVAYFTCSFSANREISHHFSSTFLYINLKETIKKEAFMFTVQDMMTPHPLFLSARDTLAQAKELMDKHGIRHLPIVDTHQHLLGLVTQRDILAAQESSLTHQSGSNKDSVMDTELGAYTDRKLHSISPLEVSKKRLSICNNIK